MVRFHTVFHVWCVVVICTIYLGQLAASDAAVGKFQFSMPNVHPYRPELYLCTPLKVDSTKSYYIVGFEPNATMHTAHHILLYGCGLPGSSLPVWNCGEMAHKENSDEETFTPCGQGASSQIIYAWARDAPKLDLPDDVGFKVGKNTTIQYLVLQVHYATVDQFADGSTDNSGIFINYTLKKKRKQGGVLVMGTSGVIEGMRNEHMETACQIRENKTMHPFAYRTHTHQLGKLVSGYRVRKTTDGKDQWTLLGKRDPLTPQMFYPTIDTTPILKNDIIAARCTMESHRKGPTYIGSTNEDEMCNFYLMYYVDNDEPLDMKYCFSQGPPVYYWHNHETGLTNIPEYDASNL